VKFEVEGTCFECRNPGGVSLMARLSPGITSTSATFDGIISSKELSKISFRRIHFGILTVKSERSTNGGVN
jgi:hypothetical protein